MEQQFLTGLLYYEEPRATLTDTLHLTDTPLVHLGEEKLRPSQAALDNLMKDFM
jgi:2-oxoglutarate/2-oxoacid ferredoxin oxidoreductase subunit beta